MSKRTRILLISVAVILAFTGFYAFYRIQKSKSPARDPLEAIPNSAFCVVSTNDIRSTWEKLNQGNLVWNALTETDWATTCSKNASLVDSLLTSEKEVGDFFENRMCWISLHCTGNDGFDYLISAALPSASDMSDFSDFIKKHSTGKKINEIIWKGNSILQIGELKNGGCSIGLREGLILISGNEELLKAGMDQLEKGATLKNDKNFLAVQQTAGEKAAANIYVNYEKLLVGLKRISSDAIHDRLDGIGHFATWTEMDLSLRPNAVLLNGYTISPDSAAGFLSVFKGQQPQRIEVASILPSTTITYTSYGISNFQLFAQRYDNYLDHEGLADERRDKLLQLKRNYNYDPNKHIANWLGNEIAMATLPASEGGTNTFALLSVASTAEAKEAFRELESNADSIPSHDTVFLHGGTDNTIPDSSGYIIKKVPVPELLPATFGDSFNELREAYYTIIKQFMVFGPDENSLRTFIAANENGNTLEKNHAYSDFATNISAEANITIYFSPSRCEGPLKENASPAFLEDIKKHTGLMRRFDGAILQYATGDNDLFYTNIFVRHNPTNKKDIASLWETQLDTTFNTKPQLVFDHKTKGLDIFIQDDANKIYLISSTGTVLWKKQLTEKIIGDVQQVDALKNGKFQLIFNTTSSLFIIDRNGNNYAPFPVKLPATATNSIKVMDYDNNRDYRFLIACADKKIYNYNIKGQKVEGWKLPTTSDFVTVQIQRAVVGDKDYVIIADHSGKVYVVDRQGNTRLNLKEQLNFSITQIFVENGKDLAHTRIVSADSIGNISRLSLTDDLERMHFMDFEETPGFDYNDINGDGIREFIFLDAHRLMTFNQDKAPVMSFTFDALVLPKPQLFFFDKKDVRIGAIGSTNAELHLINNGGVEVEGFPIKGNTPFNIGKLNGDGAWTLVCGNNGKYLCAYPLR